MIGRDSRGMRRLVAAAMLPAVAVVALALFGLLVCWMILVGSSATFGTIAFVQTLVALAASVATVAACVVYLLRGTAGLRALGPSTLGLMHAGALLVGAGALAVVVDRFFDIGALESFFVANLAGLPALLPYVVVMALRRSGADAGTVPGNTAGSVRGPMLWAPAVAAATSLAAILALCPYPFDRDGWHDDGAVARALHFRHRMAHWVAATDTFEGLERARIVEMLGDADEEGESGSAEYSVGNAPGGFFVPEHEWLVLEFDADDRVTDVSVHSID